jgi:hypothetical protein
MARIGTKITAKHLDNDETAQEQFSQRRRPDIKKYRLQVDRQTKSSYDSLEDAEAAGLAIKTAHPVVQVSIYDAAEGMTKIIEVAKE